MLSIIVSPYTPSDFESTAYVMREAFNSVGQDWDQAASEKLIREAAANAHVLVAKIDGEIVGMAIVEMKPDHLFVDAIGVLPAQKGQGVGTALWKYIEKFAHEKGMDDIKMIADPKSLAFGWYQKLGFKPTGWVELEKRA